MTAPAKPLPRKRLTPAQKRRWAERVAMCESHAPPCTYRWRELCGEPQGQL